MLDERGAEVVGVDISEKLIEVAKDRSNLNKNIEYFAGDMKEQSFGNFDYIIAMDSLIHYSTEDVISSIADFSSRANNSVLFTVIPKTFVLLTKLRLGKFFPKSERSPEVVPIEWGQLEQLEALKINASLTKIKRIKSFFYVSEAWELANR
jgi:magnesium-protoporphyrin O-methyltransferase